MTASQGLETYFRLNRRAVNRDFRPLGTMTGAALERCGLPLDEMLA